MKKFVVFALTIIMAMLMLAGCNKQVIDLTYKYDYAIIELPNGCVVDGDVTSWRDYEDGDQIQIVIDGVTYLVHSSKVALMS